MGALAELAADVRRRVAEALAPVDVGRDTAGGWRSMSPAGAGTVSQAAELTVPGWNPTIYGIVDAQAVTQGALVWRLYRSAKSGRKEDREEVTRHPALNLWNNPNPFYTQNDLAETLANHYELTGEKWLIVGRDPRSSMPVELWPMRPDRMLPVPDARQFITAYAYFPRGSAYDAVRLELDDVITDIRRHPLDPYRGQSPIAAAMTSLRSDREAGAWNAAFFANGASPGGLLKVPGTLGQTQFDEKVMRWRQQHQGTRNAHRVAILDGMKDAEYVDLKYTMRDMEFVKLHESAREDFMVAYRISDFVLGMITDVNRATAEAADVWFGKTHVIPRANRTRAMLNGKLLPLFGPVLGVGYEFDYDDPIPPDRAQALAEETAALDNALAAIAAGVPYEQAFEHYGLPADWVIEKPEPAPVPQPALPPGQDADMPLDPAAGRRRLPAARRRRAAGRVTARL